MTAPFAVQRGLLQAAKACRLTVSDTCYLIDGVEVDTATGRTAADMVADGLLYVPDPAKPGKYRPVHPTAVGLTALETAH